MDIKSDDKALLQGIILVILCLIGAIYAHITFLVGPVRAEMDRLKTQMAEAQARLETDGPELRKIRNEEQVEANNAPVENLVNRMVGTAPKVPMVECPAILSKWSQRHDFQGCKITLKSFQPFPGIQSAAIQNWNVHCAGVKPISVGEAMAELESQLPLAQISEFTISRNRAELGIQADFNIQFAIFK